jgi:hypothetical protein
MMGKKVLKKVRVSVTWIDRKMTKSEGVYFLCAGGLQKVFENSATTDDRTGELIECTEKRGESTVAERKSASGTDGPKRAENEREVLEKF